MVSKYVWEVNTREVKKGSGIVWEAIQNRGGFRHTHCLGCVGVHLKKPLESTGIEKRQRAGP